VGLESYAKFEELRKRDYPALRRMFGPKLNTGDITRFNSRFRLAKSFEGIKLDGYKEDTVGGYDAFFQVFLTHSALERFININSLQGLNALADKMAPYESSEKA
jgi:hypothetical protein